MVDRWYRRGGGPPPPNHPPHVLGSRSGLNARWSSLRLRELKGQGFKYQGKLHFFLEAIPVPRVSSGYFDFLNPLLSLFKSSSTYHFQVEALLI